MTKRAVPFRTMAVLGIGLTLLAAVLYYASTVDARPPTVRAISLTQHLSTDDHRALTTSSVQVDFSEPVDHATAQAAFTISPAVSGSFSWSAASLTYTPAARLPLRTAFAVSVGEGVRDSAGNRMVAPPGPFAFTTVGNPEVVDSDPADDQQDVALGAPVVIDFSTLMDTASVEAAIQLTPTIETRLEWSRERLTIVPVAPLEPKQRYTVTVGTGARDQAGTPLVRPFQLSFTAVATSLSARTIVPADGTAGVADTTSIAILFDRALDPGSLRDDMLTITPSVAGTLDVIALPAAAGMVDPRPRVVRFRPSGPLDPTTTYTMTLAPGLLGADGAGLASVVSWTFTTGAPAANLSNQIVYLSDRAGIANLWAMNPDGSNQRQLSAELSPIVDYAVAPDGRSFVVGDGAVLIWQRSDGSARRQLTDAGTLEFDPAYAPDGSLITFARADTRTGTSLGIWTRGPDGSDPRHVKLPTTTSAAPSASPSVPTALLRAPRISPDGEAIAFVDAEGLVDILDLRTGRLSSAAFVALTEPVWLPDSTSVVVSGIRAGLEQAETAQPPRKPVPPLDPTRRPTGTPARAIETAHFAVERGGSSLEGTVFGPGATRPALDGSGRFAFIRLSAGTGGSGRLVVSESLDDPGEEVGQALPADVSSVSFAPEPRLLVVGRRPAFAYSQIQNDGVWLVDVDSGAAQQLASSGWLPRWLP